MAKVILPRKPNAPDDPERPLAVPAEPVSTGEHSERILLLEDEAQTNLILKEYLQSFGYRVVAVANGVDGLREVIKSDFELVICDMMMPKLPGDMFYLAVQKTRPRLCGRFVFITGHQGTPEVEAFIARTQAAILVKPFRLQQLEIALRGVLTRAAKKEEEKAPLRIVPNQHFPKESFSKPTQQAAPPAAEKMPSMVAKALKLVGFMRKEEKVAPAINPSSNPRSTRRIPPQSGTITRRIPHLASTPMPASEPPRRITRRIAQATPTPPPIPTPSAPAAQVPPALPAVEPRKVTLEPTPAAPPVAATPPKIEPALILRVKDQLPETPPSASLARITRKIPAPPSSAPAPKVTRTIPKSASTEPKVTRSIPKVTRAIPKVTRSIPKVTRMVAKETTSIPKVTIRVQRTGGKILSAEEKPIRLVPKVTLKLAPKTDEPKAARVTRTIAQPAGSHRIKSENP